MEILKDVSPTEILADLLDQIEKKEEECLNKVFTRYCLLKGFAIDFNHVKRKTYKARENFWEYWYKHGTSEQFFLMSRDLIIEDGVPKLNVSFSKELIKEN